MPHHSFPGVVKSNACGALLPNGRHINARIVMIGYQNFTLHTSFRYCPPTRYCSERQSERDKQMSNTYHHARCDFARYFRSCTDLYLLIPHHPRSGSQGGAFHSSEVAVASPRLQSTALDEGNLQWRESQKLTNIVLRRVRSMLKSCSMCPSARSSPQLMAMGIVIKRKVFGTRF